TAIEQSASQYLTPDKKIGYGIPDFEKAYTILSTATYVSDKSVDNDLSIFPNPFQTLINIQQKNNKIVKNISVLNSLGVVVAAKVNPIDNQIILTDIESGMYILRIETDKGLCIKKIIKE
ncbi:MAG TPA: T9SS type A sorting domain-containing protein, partial [Chitinophagales bacterium]|nr:T9SS type A sorting domain-containing protein [Chitinophagales bacterium]